MPSPSTTPTFPYQVVQPSKASGWPRLLTTQQPPKAAKPEVTLHSPSFASAEKHPFQPSMEQTSPKHQFLPLSSLPSIAELPRQEPPPEVGTGTRMPALIQSSQAAAQGSFRESGQVSEDKAPGPMDEVPKWPQVQGTAEVMETSLSSSLTEAAGKPVPQSPGPDDSPDSAVPRSSPGLDVVPEGDSQRNRGSDNSTADAIEPADASDGEPKDTWASRLASILPRTTFDQPTQQNTTTAKIEPSRSPSVAPGAYPESESAGESPTREPGADTEFPEVKDGQSESTPRSDNKSVRSRKSVSIALPDFNNDNQPVQGAQTDSTGGLEHPGNNMLPPANQKESEDKTEVKQRLGEDAMIEREPSREAEEDQGKTAAQLSDDPALDHLKTPNHGDAPFNDRASSIAPSQGDSDRLEVSTIHDRESLTHSDADNSSLKPLLSSSPRERRSSHFSESLDDSHSAPVMTEVGKGIQAKGKNKAEAAARDDDSSSQSTIISSTTSETEEVEKERIRDLPSPPVGNGEGPSRTASSLPPPKIVVKDASEAESSLNTPSLVAPATTPVQDDSVQRRQITFVALGESLSDQRPIKLPMKRRKLYVRRARYAVLRQPILNAALGRQVGAQAKAALKRLANGELIIVKPPSSL
ncbi:MAG: hypothetical protein Q9201_000231 [Fulgogasparrea decipioides]